MRTDAAAKGSGMRRMMWTAVGAAAGIYVYRRVQEAVGEARERGVAGNVQVATSAATALATQMRGITSIGAAGLPSKARSAGVRDAGLPGRAAAAVLREQAR